MIKNRSAATNKNKGTTPVATLYIHFSCVIKIAIIISDMPASNCCSLNETLEINKIDLIKIENAKRKNIFFLAASIFNAFRYNKKTDKGLIKHAERQLKTNII